MNRSHPPTLPELQRVSGAALHQPTEAEDERGKEAVLGGSWGIQCRLATSFGGSCRVEVFVGQDGSEGKAVWRPA